MNDLEKRLVAALVPIVGRKRPLVTVHDFGMTLYLRPGEAEKIIARLEGS